MYFLKRLRVYLIDEADIKVTRETCDLSFLILWFCYGIV